MSDHGDAGEVLVYVGLDLVGDGLMKLPFLGALRRAYPRARITWLAGQGPSAFNGALAPLVAGRLDAVVDDAGVGVSARELLTRPLARTPLAGRRFDVVLDTQRRLLTTLILKRIPADLFVSSCGGFALSDRRPRERARPAALAGQLTQLLEAATGRPAPAAPELDLPSEAGARAARLLPGAGPYVGLVPGAGGRHKCWPLANHLAVARELRDRGLQPVVLLGPQEADWAAAVREGCPEALLPLQQVPDDAATPTLTIALGRQLAAAVAGDCGAGHMLAAAGTPLVSLFGPTDPAKFAPHAARLQILRAQDFADTRDPAGIPVSAVTAALDRLLAAEPAAESAS
jgi:ADP-heptose:LPS heptosyltransferase